MSVDSDAQEQKEAAMPEAEPRVGIVIVHYNCLYDTLRCLGSLAKLDYANCFVVVIDSRSPDGSGETVRALVQGTEHTVILSPENSGFAAASNIGMSYARLLDAEYIWLLNPDTEVESDTLTSLIRRALLEPQGGAFGSKILYGVSEENGNVSAERIIWGAGGKIDFEHQSVSMRGAREADEGQFDREDTCDYLPGCSLLVRSDVIDRIGFIPEEYFMYFEESDWCSRMRREGYTLWYVPESVVWHHFDDGKTEEPFGVYYYNRNERLFWSRYGGMSQRVGLILRTLFRDLPRALHALMHAPDERHVRIFKAHIASHIDFLFRRWGKCKSLDR